MQTTVTTTITTAIDVETFAPTHSVDIAAENVLPNELVLAAALGGAEATAKTIRQANPSLPRSLEDFVEGLANQELTDADFRRQVIGFIDGE